MSAAPLVLQTKAFFNINPKVDDVCIVAFDAHEIDFVDAAIYVQRL